MKQYLALVLVFGVVGLVAEIAMLKRELRRMERENERAAKPL